MTNQVSENILYTGIDDLDIDLFESQYTVPEGMSYNSWVIIDQKIAIMDTADARKGQEWLHNIDETLKGRQPAYLICHHMEPDHSALVAQAMELYPAMTLVCSQKASQMMLNFFHGADLKDRTLNIKEGDTLELGSHTLHFIAAPMVHWPEVMMSYESTEKVLFAADGFGKFGALCHETEDWACEARRYYFNICGKYGAQVQSVLKKAAKLDIQAICPLHGPVLTDQKMQDAISLYDTWSRYEAETDGVLVVYASIHGGTAAAAQRMGEILKAKGAPKVVVSDLSRDDLAEVIEDAFRYPRILCCAASYDGGVFPPMHDLLYHLQIKNYQKRTFGLLENGSWAPCAARAMRSIIETMKDCKIVEPVVTITSRMKDSDLQAMEALADALLKG